MIAAALIVVVGFAYSFLGRTGDGLSNSADAPTEPEQTVEVSLICPPDIYSDSYEAYLQLSDAQSEVRIEPGLYGSVSDMERLNGVANTLRVPSDGIALLLTAEPFEDLYIGQCVDGCRPSSHQSLMAACRAELGARCIEFAISIDGVTQCLMTPKSEP